MNRYQALNLSNKNTVEYRVLSSTLDPIVLESYLELIWHIANKSLIIDWSDVGDWDIWMCDAPEIVLNYINSTLK